MNISIITATFNAAATIADCLASVRSQQQTGTGTCGASPLVEHIIIDGASTDNTLEIVQRSTCNVQRSEVNTPDASRLTASHPSRHSDSRFPRIYSEPDHGIYDAMNKGIALATGEVIGILNADDFYASPDVLARVAQVFEDPAVMSCYGDLEYVRDRETGNVNGEAGNVKRKKGYEDRETGNVKREVGIDARLQDAPFTLHPSQYLDSPFTVFRYWKSGPFSPDRFYWGWMPPHPTFFVRRSVYERCGLFNLDQGSAADYELMLRLLLKERITTVYIPEVLVRMRVGGASNETLAARLKANRMDRRAWEVNGLKPYPWTLMLKPLRKLPQYFFAVMLNFGLKNTRLEPIFRQ